MQLQAVHTSLSICTECALGYRRNQNSGECEICPVNTYTDTHRAVTCTPCPANQGTSQAGSTSSQCRKKLIHFQVFGLFLLRDLIHIFSLLILNAHDLSWLRHQHFSSCYLLSFKPINPVKTSIIFK